MPGKGPGNSPHLLPSVSGTAAGAQGWIMRQGPGKRPVKQRHHSNNTSVWVLHINIKLLLNLEKHTVLIGKGDKA